MKKILYIVVSAFVMHTVHGQEIRPSAQPLPEKNYLSYEELIKASANQEDYLWANEAFSHEDRTKEVVGKRSFGSKTFSTDNPRQFLMHAASGEIHYEENGEWKTIYHSFLPKGDQFVNEHNRFKSYYSRNLSAGGYTILPDGKKMEELRDLEMIFLDENGNELQRVVNSEVSGKVFRNELVYSNAFGDFVDVQIQQLSHKKKLDYVLREGFANELPQGTKYVAFREVVLLPSDYQVELEQQKRASLEELNEDISRCERKLNALAEKGAEINEKGEDIAKERIKIEQKLSELIQLREIALNDAKSGAVRNVESLTVLDGNGNFAFNIPFPTLSDQSEDEEISSPMATSKKGIASLKNENSFYNVTRNGNELTIDVMVDANWLTAEERVYPVFVDPTTTYEPPYTTWWTGRSTPTGKYNDNIYVGTSNPVSDPYVGYEKNDISAFPAGAQVSQILYTFLPYDERSAFNSTQINITEADLDPQTVGNTDLRNDLFTENDAYLTGIDASYWGFASSWVNAEWSILTTGDLGASAHTKFESQAASTTWFALGMRHTTSPPTTNDQLRIEGYSSGYYPYITVTYIQLPTVTTSAVSYTIGTSATGAGNVTSDGGCTVTDRGVCWSSTNATPTIADSYASDATLATGTGAFSNVPMTVGYSSVVYYRAYATCASGTVYGNVLSFTTETPAGAPLPTGFYISGTVTNNGTIISTNDQNWMRMTGASKQVTGSGTFTGTRIFADGSTSINPTSSVTFTQTYVNASKSLEVLTGKTMNNGSMTNVGTLTLSGTGAINNSDYWFNGASGTVTFGGAGTIYAGANWTNDGTFTAGTGTVEFNGSTSGNTINGTTAFYKATINKGSSTATILDVVGTVTQTNVLTFTNGLLRIPTGGSWTKTGNGPTIGATSGLHVNGGAFTQNGASITNNGLFKTTTGTATIGSSSGNSITNQSGSSFIIDGAGTVNIAGRLVATGSGSFNQSAGTLNVCTSGNGSSSVGSLDMASGTSFTMTGGAINMVQKSTGGTQIDYKNLAGTVSIWGGTLTIGTTATSASSNFNIQGAMPPLVIDNTTNAKTATINGSSTVYGNVTINSTSSLVLNSGVTATVNGSLSNSGTYNATGSLNLAGDWTNTGTVTAAAPSLVTFFGSSDQNVTSGGSAFANVTLNNTGGNAVLSSAAEIDGALTLTSGDIDASSFDLTLSASATASAGSDASHVIGTMVKTTASTSKFTFPLGDGTYYKSIAITPGSSSTVWTAQYYNTVYAYTNLDPTGTNGTPTSGDIDQVSDSEYWDLDRSGSADAIVEIAWVPQNSLQDYTSLRLAHFDGTDWDMVGNDPQGINASGVISSSSALSTFSPFTLATGPTATALPIELLSFSGDKKDRKNILNWTTASEINNDYFTIEKSYNGFDFEWVGTQKGAGNSNQIINYSLTDHNIRETINYYRLMQTDFDGEYVFSKTISIDNRNDDSLKEVLRKTNLLGQEIGDFYNGVVIILYKDGTSRKMFQYQ